MSDSNIAAVSLSAAPQQTESERKTTAPSQTGFGQWLVQSISEVNRMEQASNTAAQDLISGQSKDIHGTMIAMQKAGIALDLTMEIRNKVIAAYDEIKRMQF